MSYESCIPNIWLVRYDFSTSPQLRSPARNFLRTPVKFCEDKNSFPNTWTQIRVFVKGGAKRKSPDLSTILFLRSNNFHMYLFSTLSFPRSVMPPKGKKVLRISIKLVDRIACCFFLSVLWNWMNYPSDQKKLFVRTIN